MRHEDLSLKQLSLEPSAGAEVKDLKSKELTRFAFMGQPFCLLTSDFHSRLWALGLVLLGFTLPHRTNTFATSNSMEG